MATSFLQGILFGLGLSILVGPILFILVQVSLERGYRSGLVVAIGIWISDLMYILSSYLLITLLDIDLLDPDLRFYFAMIGGTVLLAVGVGMFTRKAAEPVIHTEWSGKKLFYFLSLGFSTNTFNPFTVFFWFTIMATQLAEGGPGNAVAAFVIGVLMTLMITDSSKVLAAHWVRRYLKPRTVIAIRKVSASIIVAFGLWLIGAGFNG